MSCVQGPNAVSCYELNALDSRYIDKEEERLTEDNIDKDKEGIKLKTFVGEDNYVYYLIAISIALVLLCVGMCCWVRSKTTAMEKKQKETEKKHIEELALWHH